MELMAALKALDPAIDAHWTEDGQPDLNALKEMVGKRVTRKAVDKLAPDLTRGIAAEAASEEPPVVDDAGHGIRGLCAAFAALTTDEIRHNGSLAQIVMAYHHHHGPMMQLHKRNMVKGRT